MTAVRVKIGTVSILHWAVAVLQRPIICLGEMETSDQTRYNLLSRLLYFLCVFLYCPGFVIEAPACSNSLHKTLMKVLLVGCGACFSLTIPNTQCTLEVSY